MAGSFFGRARELELIADAVARGRKAASAVIVVGDPGSGKSRLLAEAMLGLERRPVLRVAGFEPEQRVPLAAAARAVRALSKAGDAGKRLEQLLLEPAQDRSVLEPIRIFEAAYRALEHLSSPVLVVDDLQWVDETSVALLHYLLRGASADALPVAVVAACRPSPAASAFRNSLERILPPDDVAGVDLGPLEREAGVALARSLDGALDVTAAEALWKKAAGSPFWLEALAHAGGALASAAELLASRVRGASADAAALLALLAVAARPLPAENVAELEGWPTVRVESAADELVGRGLVIRSATALCMAHDLIAEAAAVGLPARTRSGIHRRLAAALERDAGDDLQQLLEALGHRAAAGVQTIDLALRVASAPRRTLVGEDGLRQLGDIADEADPTDASTLDLHEAVAEIAAQLGAHALALEHFTLVGEKGVDPRRRGLALLRASGAAQKLGRSHDARSLLERVRSLERADELLEIEVDAQDALVSLWLEHDVERAESLAALATRHARELVHRLGSIDTAPVELRAAHLAAIRAEYDAAQQAERDHDMLRLADEMADVARGFDEPAHLEAMMRRGMCLLWFGRARDAEPPLALAWAESRRRVLPALAVSAGVRYADCLHDLGRLAEAHAVMHDVDALQRRTDAALSLPRYQLHHIGLSYGKWSDAVRSIDSYLEQQTDPHGRVTPQGVVAMFFARMDDESSRVQALRRMAAARADAEAAACPRCIAGTMLWFVEVLVRVGQAADAAQLLEEWDELRPNPHTFDRLTRRRVGALMAASDGDLGRAAALLEELQRDYDKAGFCVEALWTRLDLAGVLARSDRDRAAAVLIEAIEVAAAMGAMTQQKLAERRLRALGIRRWRRGPSAPTELSERERQVAALVAGGASNPEVARQLFLSRKTVEFHVSNVLRKLGARNRTELATKLARVRGAAAED